MERDLPKVELGAGGYVIDPVGRVLLIEQSRPGVRHWGSIGGGLEHGESIEECAVREILEGSGLRVRLEKLVAIYQARRAGQLFGVGFMYVARPDPWPQRVLLLERDGAATFHDFGWFSREEIPSLSVFPDDLVVTHWPPDIVAPLMFVRDVE
jgi:ADP-ribose pyrophosphatase YjhB (NUDIX family)